MDRRILVVEDNTDTRNDITTFLNAEGFTTVEAPSATEAIEHLKSSYFSVILVDVMMPGEDGFSLCRRIRETVSTPIMFVSARGDDEDRIRGLELGADDFLPKPFNPRELLARIQALVRRAKAAPLEHPAKTATNWRFESYTFKAADNVIVGEDGVAMVLSTGETNLLSVFVQRPRTILSREELSDLARGRSAEIFDRSIDNMISRLRRKIEHEPKHPMLIKTVWGAGYIFNADPEPL